MGNFRKHSPRVFWSEAEVNILMEHYPSLSAAELLEKLPGRTIRVIQCKANGLGLSRTKPKKRTAEQTREAKRKHMAERRAENPEAMRAVSRSSAAMPGFRGTVRGLTEGRTMTQHTDVRAAAEIGKDMP